MMDTSDTLPAIVVATLSAAQERQHSDSQSGTELLRSLSTNEIPGRPLP